MTYWSNSGNSMRGGLLREFWICFALSNGCLAAGFHSHHYSETVFLKATRKMRAEIGQIKIPQRLLPKVSHFSRINTSQIVASILLISRILESWFWQFFSSVFIAFMEKQIFACPYYAIPECLWPLTFLYKLLLENQIIPLRNLFFSEEYQTIT